MAFAVCSIKGLSFADNAGQRPWKGLHALYSFLITFWAVMVGASRIFVGKHFLGDVLVGFTVGLVFALILSEIVEKLFNARASKSTLAS